MSASFATATGRGVPAAVSMGASWLGDDDEDGAELAAGTSLTFGPDRQIYGEGSTAKVFFKVVTGVVRTCKFLSDGRRQIDAFHTPGQMFGIEAGAAYAFSAEAVTECTVVAYRRLGLEISMSRNADLSQRVFAHAMQSLARAQDHALLLGRRSAVEKVAAFLVEWAGRSADPATAILAMTRQDIADYLGLTIETVSRTLSQLEREAMIGFASARHIRLKDPRALRALNS